MEVEELFIATACKGDVEKVECFLKIKPWDVDVLTKALVLASGNGHTETAKILIRGGADVRGRADFQDKIEEYLKICNALEYLEVSDALEVAIESGHTETARMLIQHGADVNDNKEGVTITPLMRAVDRGHLDTARMLIRHGANVNDRSICGPTALIFAVEKGYVEIVRMLIQKKANVNSRAEKEDGYSHNETVLMCAVRSGCAEIVKMLIDAKADISDDRIGDDDGHTILWLAIDKGRTEIAKILIESNVNVNALDFEGRSPLIYAIQKGNIEVVGMLTAKGADVNNRGFYAQTALMVACREGHADVVEILIANAADIYAQDRDGKTALDFATDENVEKILWKARISADLWSKKELTEGDLAKVKEEEDFVRDEVKCQASLNRRILLHVLKRAEDELRGWLYLDDREDGDLKEESNDLLKNTYRQASQIFGKGPKGYFCVREMQKFENRIGYQAMSKELFFGKAAPNATKFDAIIGSGSFEGETIEDIFKRIKKILDENGKMSMDDVQFALDFVNHDFLTTAQNVKDWSNDVNDEDKVSSSHAALLQQEKDIEEGLLVKLGLSVKRDASAMGEREGTRASGVKKMRPWNEYKAHVEEEQKAASSQQGRGV